MVCAIDIVPGALVSNYCFYSPDYRFLKLGTYSALYEIQWVVDHPAVAQYYYMVFYVPGNKRMGYKMEYQPSDFLCPVIRQWRPAHELDYDAMDLSVLGTLANNAPTDGDADVDVEAEALGAIAGCGVDHARQALDAMLVTAH